jgi:hypothetical protein
MHKYDISSDSGYNPVRLESVERNTILSKRQLTESDLKKGFERQLLKLMEEKTWRVPDDIHRLATALGYKPKRVENWFTQNEDSPADNKPSLLAMIHIAQTFGKSLDWLLDLDTQ